MESIGEPTRVQTLAQAGVSHVPPQYIQPPENRPTTKVHQNGATTASPSNVNIPVIDLSGFDSKTRRDRALEQIGEACRDWGAFHVVNHGVPKELLDGIRSVGLSFFNNHSMPEKLSYACDPNTPASEGYGSRMLAVGETENEDTVLDWRDYFDHHTLPLSRRDPSRWPVSPPDYKRVVAEYSDQMKVLAQKLLGLISESLDLPCSCIEDSVGEFYQNITISYYPPCPRPDLTLGLQSHSDFGAVTLLIQDDVGGLEVLKDGEWVFVEPLSDAVLVILADQTEIMTNGEYRSSVHRAVTNPSRARLSVATFHDPAKTKKISPDPELVRRSSRARYREVLYGDYVSSWYTKGPDGKRNIDALLI